MVNIQNITGPQQSGKSTLARALYDGINANMALDERGRAILCVPTIEYEQRIRSLGLVADPTYVFGGVFRPEQGLALYKPTTLIIDDVNLWKSGVGRLIDAFTDLASTSNDAPYNLVMVY